MRIFAQGVYFMKLSNPILKCIEVLTLLSKEPTPLTLTEIANATGIPKSSVADVIYTLVEKDFVVFDNKELKTYKLGMALFQIGSAAVARLDIAKIADKHLEHLASKFGQTAYLAIEQGKNVIYVLRKDGESPVTAASRVGESNGMYYTGIGKAILAGKSDESVRNLYGEGPYEKKTDKTIATYDELLEEMRQIRERGYSIDNREGNDLIFCLAAPIVKFDNTIVAAISLVFFYPLYEKEQHEEYVNALLKTAYSISRKLGYRGNDFYKDVIR